MYVFTSRQLKNMVKVIPLLSIPLRFTSSMRARAWIRVQVPTDTARETAVFRYSIILYSA